MTYYADTPLLLTARAAAFAAGMIRLALHVLQLSRRAPGGLSSTGRHGGPVALDFSTATDKVPTDWRVGGTVMAQTQANIASLDPVWSTIRARGGAGGARRAADGEPRACRHPAPREPRAGAELSHRAEARVAGDERPDPAGDRRRGLPGGQRGSGSRRGPTSWRSSSAIRPATATCSRCCSSRGSRRCSATASATGCGSTGARTWPTSSRCGRRRCSGSTSIPARGWATAS